MYTWVKNILFGKIPANVVLRVDSDSIEKLVELKKELEERGFKVDFVETNAWTLFSDNDIIIAKNKE